MHMFSERLQILLSREQRRRLEAEAKRRRASVGSLVREAIDARFGAKFSRAERIRAVEEISRMEGGRSLTVEEMERIVDEEREANFAPRRRG